MDRSSVFQVGHIYSNGRKHFPDISDEILKSDNQRHALANSREFTTCFRHSNTSIGWAQRPPSHRFQQWRNRVWVKWGNSFCYNTQEIFDNHHPNTLITNSTCYEVCTLSDVSSTPTSEHNNHYYLADRTLQSEHLINLLPCSNQQQQPHNPNICWNDQETASIE